MNTNGTGSMVVANAVGVDPVTSADIGNASIGINVVGGATGVLVENNLLAFNAGQGLGVGGGLTTGVTLTRNLLWDNSPPQILLSGGANDLIVAPVISGMMGTTLIGTSMVPNGTIEIFGGAMGDVLCYEGSTTTDAGGDWSYTGAVTSCGAFVIATVTNAGGSTSMLSSPFAP